MSLNLFNLSGRLALVTGSSQGIGLAMAAGLARAGAHAIPVFLTVVEAQLLTLADLVNA